jgi:hypothetical protein
MPSECREVFSLIMLVTAPSWLPLLFRLRDSGR